jgi:glyoxalase family protein
MGRRGTNQAREVLLAAPAASLDYWSARLTERGVEVAGADVLDSRRLLFRHPCGIEYALVGVDDDPREGWTGGGVPIEHAIHGIYGVGVHVNTPETMVEFTADHLAGKQLVEEGDRVRLQVGAADRGGAVELVVNRTDDQGTWRYGEGTIHHFAWNAGNLQNQDELKFAIEGAGYTDISELKDRTYFKSHYVRTPGGALFELAVTHDDGGWDCDESPEELGRAFMLPPQFEHEREKIMSQLEPVSVEED